MLRAADLVLAPVAGQEKSYAVDMVIVHGVAAATSR
jgi:hypothetical protein